MQAGTPGIGIWIIERRNLIDDDKQPHGEEPKVIEDMRLQVNS
jgi:hypothetical protein